MSDYSVWDFTSPFSFALLAYLVLIKVHSLLGPPFTDFSTPVLSHFSYGTKPICDIAEVLLFKLYDKLCGSQAFC